MPTTIEVEEIPCLGVVHRNANCDGYHPGPGSEWTGTERRSYDPFPACSGCGGCACRMVPYEQRQHGHATIGCIGVTRAFYRLTTPDVVYCRDCATSWGLVIFMDDPCDNPEQEPA